MPRVHLIKSARKDYPGAGIKKGDTYYKWSIKTGPASGIVRRSKTYPKPSELTASSFMAEYLSLCEEISGMETSHFDTAEDLSSAMDELIGRIESLRDETEGSLENMPEGFKEGDVGQMLQTRIEGLDSWVSDLQGVDLNFSFDDEDEPEQEEDEDEDDFNMRYATWEDHKRDAEKEFITNAIEEIQGMEASIE